MSKPRLKAGLKASALVRIANANGRLAMVLRRGDADAGAILLVLRDRIGRFSVLSQTLTTGGELVWSQGTGPDPVPEQEANDYVSRQVARDPDLWILEIEGTDLSLDYITAI